MLRINAPLNLLGTSFAKMSMQNWLFFLLFCSSASYAGVSASPSSSSGSHTINWTSVANTDHYTVTVSGERIATYNVGTSQSKTFAEISNGTYTYKVTAWGEDVWRPAIQEWVPGPPTNVGTVNVVVTIPVPGSPSSISVPSTDNNGSFSISWGGSSGIVSHYELYEKKNSGSFLLAYSGSLRAFTFSGNTDGTYSYQVKACNDTGCGGYRTGSNTLSVKVKPGTPGTPNNPLSDPDGYFPISWTAASGVVTYYDLQQSTNGGSTWNTVYTGASPSTSASGLDEGTYKYRVNACNTYSWSCTLSAEKQTIVDFPDTTAVATPPATNDGSALTVSWGASLNGFVLHEYPSGREWQVEGASSSYVITAPASDGDNYRYSVARCIVFNEGAGASTEFICGNAGPQGSAMQVRRKPSAAAAPTLSSPTSTAGTVNLTWAKPSGAVTKYYVQKELNNAGTWSNVGSSQTGTSKTVSGLTEGNWKFRIRSCNEFDWSCSDGIKSAELKVRTIPSIPAAPILASSQSAGSINLDWTDITGATYYDVQKRKDNAGTWTSAASGRTTSDAPVSGLTDGLWDFKVSACNEFSWACSNFGSVSSDVMVRLKPGTPGTPTNPSNSDSGIYTVTWGAASGNVTHYLLQESANGGSSWNTIFSDSGLVRSFLVNNPIEGIYQYKVVACNEFSWACTESATKQTKIDFPNTAGAPSLPPKNPGTSYIVSWAGPAGMGFILTEYPSGRTWQDKDLNQLTVPAPSDDDYTYTITSCFVFNEGGGASDEYRCGAEGPQSSAIKVRRPPILQGGMGILLNVTNGDITVSWPPAIPNGDYYQVTEINTAIAKTANAPDSSIVFPGRTNGDYRYEYYACNELDYCSDPSVEQVITLLTIPSKVQLLTAPATDNDGEYSVSWNDASGIIEDYKIREFATGVWNNWIALGPAKSYSPSDIKLDGNYSYEVKACNAAGCSGAESVNVGVLHSEPDAPDNLSVSVSGLSRYVRLDWDRYSGGFDDYYEYRIAGSNWELASATTYTFAEVPAEGSYIFEVRACNAIPNSAAKCSSVPASAESGLVKIPQPWVEAVPIGLTLTDQSFSALSFLAHEIVGAVAGEGSVNGGAASYSIPIQLPPGRAGIQPRVDVSYSSRAGNGVLGMGWQLNAESSIARCGQTLAHDGRNLGIQLNDQIDRLCLDGQRLVAESGNYFAHNTIYHPESDIRTRVIQSGVGSAATFKAMLPNGVVRDYGVRQNSKFMLMDASSPLSWHVSTEADSSGNTINYFYTPFGYGENHLTEIWYTGVDTYSGDRKIKFVYESGSRPDISSRYIAGGLIRQARRLERIEISVAGEKQREYNFWYGTSRASQRSLLTNIEECAYAGETSHCLPATEFVWKDASPSFTIEKVGYRNSSSTGNNYDESSPADVIAQLQLVREIEDIAPQGDVDGNGVNDWHGWHSDAEGFKSSVNSKTLQTCQWNSLTYTRVCMSADFNQDGKTDSWQRGAQYFELAYEFDGNGNPVWFSTQIPNKRNAASTKEDRIESIGDFNGDGFPDLVVRSDVNTTTAYLYLHLHSGNHSNPYSAASQLIYTYRDSSTPNVLGSAVQFVGDLDGNGLPDFVDAELDMVLTSTRAQSPQPLPFMLYLTQVDAQGNVTFNTVSLSSFARAAFSTGGGPASPLEYYFHYFMDVNGDGLPDWLSWLGSKFNGSEISLAINQGGFFADWKVIDGSEDLLATREFPYYVAAGGEGWQVAKFPKYSHSFRLADLNSDGRQELLVPGQRIVTNCQSLFEAGGPSGPKCGDAMYNKYDFGGSGGYSVYPVEDLDESLYNYNALSFEENSDGSFSVISKSSGLVGSATQTAVVDAFGNGLSDFVFSYGCREPTDCTWLNSWSEGDFGVYVNRNRGSATGNERYEPTDMLISVESGVGLRDEWHYRPLSSRDDRYHSDSKPFYERGGYLDGLNSATKNNHFEFTSSMYVVAEHRQSNGIGDDLNRRQYRYKGAVFNQKGRGFQGFHSIIEEDLAANIETQSDFHQIFPLAGKVFKQRKWELGDRSTDASSVKAFEESNFKWQFWPMGGQGSPVVVDSLTDNWTVSANDPYFVGPQSQSTVHRTLKSARTELYTQSQTSSFDQWGNLLLADNRYEEAGSSHIATSSTDTAYVAADLANWWINKPLKQTITKHAIQNRSGIPIAPGTDAEQSVVIDYLQWDDNARKPKQVKTSPSSGKWSRVDTVYNSNGLPSKVTTTTAEGESLSRFVETTAFSSDGYFPKAVKNALGHSVTTIVNPRFGKPDSVIDANGLETQFEYDAFGRIITVTAPIALGLKAAPDAHTALQWCNPSCSTAPSAVYKTIQQQAGTPTQITYHDLLGRVIQSEVQAFNSSDWIVVKKQFNALGQTTFESVPHYASNPNSFGTEYLSYDTFGRALHKTVDQTNSQQLDVVYTHEQGIGFTTDIQVNGRAMSRTYNGLQQLTQTVDALQGSTDYAYDGAGNPIVLQDANTNRITAFYNALGQKDWVNDPNMGAKTFSYSGFGEVEGEGDANGNNTVFEYDRLGRLLKRSVNGIDEAEWTYDNPANGIGLPHTETRLNIGAGQAFNRSYQYDSLSRPQTITTNIDGEDFLTINHYDKNYGRHKGLSYPSGLTLQYSYNDSGYPFKTSNAASGYSYREITQMDAWGEWDFASVGASNYTIGRAFYAETGQMAGTAFDSQVQNHQLLDYSYDDFGNLKEMIVGVPSQNPAINTETYLYDALNRLDYSQRTDGPSIDYDYDAIGNLLKKDDFASSYSYTGGASGGPSAVKNVTLIGGGTKTYGYDANGNRISEGAGGTRNIWYNAFNKPTRINRNGADLAFSYGADQMRYKQINQSSGKQTLYIDKVFEQITEGTETHYRHFIDDIAVVTTTETSSETTHKIGFTHRDRLGSTVAIGDHQGNLQETHSFDPFGKPRLGNITDKLPGILESQFTTRGFTDHEHLDDVELIHMNGRAYDYNLGRFLSVDPFIQAPGNSQSLNPYSYIMNNPLAGTDPTGYKSDLEQVTGSHIKKDLTKLENAGGSVTVGGSKLVTSVGVSANGANKSSSSQQTTQTSPQNINQPSGREQIAAGDQGNGQKGSESSIDVNGDVSKTLAVASAGAGILGDNNLVMKTKPSALPFNTKIASTWDVALESSSSGSKMILVGGEFISRNVFVLGMLNDMREGVAGQDSKAKTLLDIAVGAAPFFNPATTGPAIVYQGVDAFYPGGVNGYSRDFKETVKYRTQEHVVKPAVRAVNKELGNSEDRVQRFWHRVYQAPYLGGVGQ